MMRSYRQHAMLVLMMAGAAALVGLLWAWSTATWYEARVILLLPDTKAMTEAQSPVGQVSLRLPGRESLRTISLSPSVVKQVYEQLKWQRLDAEGGWRALQQRLYVNVINDELFELQARSIDPADAKQLADTWAMVTMQTIKTLYGTADRQRAELERQIVEARKDWQEAMAELEKYEAASGLASQRQELAIVEEQLGYLNARRHRLAMLESELNEIAQAGEAGTENPVAGATAQLGRWAQLLELERAVLERSGQTKQDESAGPTSRMIEPAAVSQLTVDQRIEDLRGAMAQLGQTLGRQRQVVHERVQQLQTSLSIDRHRRSVLEDEVEQAHERLTLLTRQRNVLDVVATDQDELISLASASSEPREPVSLPPLLLAALAGLAGAFAGLGVSLLCDLSLWQGSAQPA